MSRLQTSDAVVFTTQQSFENLTHKPMKAKRVNCEECQHLIWEHRGTIEGDVFVPVRCSLTHKLEYVEWDFTLKGIKNCGYIRFCNDFKQIKTETNGKKN